MKQKDVRVGRFYARRDKRGKRTVRKVVDEGPQYKLYEGVVSDDCLKYEVVEGGMKNPGKLVSTRESFAQWAQEDVTEEFQKDTQ